MPCNYLVDCGATERERERERERGQAPEKKGKRANGYRRKGRGKKGDGGGDFLRELAATGKGYENKREYEPSCAKFSRKQAALSLTDAELQGRERSNERIRDEARKDTEEEEKSRGGIERQRETKVMDFIRPVGGRPSAFFLSFLNHLRAALCPPLPPTPFGHGPSLIVFHSFLRPFHFVTVWVARRPCETFTVPHGWPG